MYYTYLEVCAGCGGLSYGLELSGLKPVTLIEIDKKCVETLKKNFNCDIQCEDMRKIDFKKYKSKIDLVIGGIPCQSFSMAGKREGLNNKDKGGLFYDFKRCIQEIEPDMFMIENVEGLHNINNGDTLKFIINELEKENYTVTYKLLNAVNYYVPQKRKRLIIIGTKYNIPFEFPQPFNDIITLKDALKNVPNSNYIEYSDTKKIIMELIPEGGCWINLPKNLQKEYLGKSYNSGGGKRGFARRLSWNEPSLTLTTSPCQKQTERCHPTETRPLKTREYARIQTFPDNFIFEGNTISIYKQIGNAVPPMLAYFIGLQIKKTLFNIKIYKIIKNIYNLHIIFDKKNEKHNICKYINRDLYKLLFMSELKEIVQKYLEKEVEPLYEDIKINKDIDKVKKAMDIRFLNIDESEWQIKSNFILNQSKIQQKIGLMHEYIFSNLERCAF
jgi:DNA (cytosine-5)-methyltransferase 1